MSKFERPLQLRWSDMDPNFHLRHSVYYDFGAQLRTEFLFSHGLNPKIMAEQHFGPVLFREEALYKREVHFGDELKMNLEAVYLKKDGSRFSIRHRIFRKEQVCAEVLVEGAWMDTVKRKLTVPPKVASDALSAMAKAEDFKWLD